MAVTLAVNVFLGRNAGLSVLKVSITLCFIHNMASHDSKEEAVAVYISLCITDKVVSN